MHLSPYHFLRMFRRSTGTTPHRFLLELRMRHGAALLRRGSTPIAVIAAACGYDSPSRFSEAFRRHFGASPSRYRAETS